ncbi:MAG: AAA family ATPase [Bacteroidaceae bacterium]|nr:AAA family ATPase [Bacteroidaceae bacterium]
MQKQLPIGVQNFEKIIKGNKLYVDKTTLIYRMTQEYNYVFLSHPRRFATDHPHRRQFLVREKNDREMES